MKKFKFGVFAGVIALLMALSSANTVALADDAKGNVVIQDEDWEADTAADPIVLNNVTAKELIVEGGSENVLKINGGSIDTVSVVAPKLEEMGYKEIVALLELGVSAEDVSGMYREYLTARKEVNKLKPTINVGGDAVIEALTVSSGANLNLAGSEVKEVIVDNDNSSERLTITIQNYDGKVSLGEGAADQLTTIKLVNSSLEELNVNGQANSSYSVQGDKKSSVATVNVSGSTTMVVDVTATDVIVAEDAEKCALRVYSDVENVVVSADNCEFGVAASATVTNAKVEGDNVKLIYNGVVENAEVTGESSEVKYEEITPPPLPTATPTPTPIVPKDVTNDMVGTYGATDCTTPWWTVHTDTVKVEKNAAVTVTFKNYTNGATNWNNFLVVLQNVANAHSAADNGSYKEYAVLRADNYGWGPGYDGIVTPVCNWNWDTFTSDINGATVKLTITNKNGKADVVADITTVAGTKYNQKYTGIAIDGDLYFCLTVEGGYLLIEEKAAEPEPTPTEAPAEPEVPVEPETPVEPPKPTDVPLQKGSVLGNEDFTTGWWTAFSEAMKVEAGNKATVTFKNYNGVEANWFNYMAVLQNVADAKDESYAEYAVLRADNYGWGSGYDGIVTPETDAAADWAAWLADMNGATVELTVTNHGETADVVAEITAEDGTTYYQKYTGIKVTGDLYFRLTVEKAYLVIEDVEYTKVSEDTEDKEETTTPTPEPTVEPTPTPVILGAEDCSTAWWTVFSKVENVKVGETATVKFQNFTKGELNHQNFVVILKDEARNVEYAVTRPDHYGWSGALNTNANSAELGWTLESNWNWDTFRTDMNGATVVLTIKNNGTTADVLADITTATGDKHFQNFKGIKIDGALDFCLSVEGGYLVIK